MNDKPDDHNDDEDESLLERSLKVLSNPGPFIVKNLHMMIKAEPPYHAFKYAPEIAKGIWLAAANMIEEYERRKLH